MEYPVRFEADYAERRSRLTVLLRGILAIPLFVWIYLYGIAAWFGVVIAWLAIVVTGRYPDGLYRFNAGFVRVLSLTSAYVTLLTDAYPPFGPEPREDYPVRMRFAGPLPRYRRARTFFRGILAIPIYILRYALNILLEIFAFGAWVVILVLGRLPRGLFDGLLLVNSYIARSDAYLFLLTETYPPFQDADTRAAGIAGL